MPLSHRSLFTRRALRIAALKGDLDPGAEAARAQFRLDYAARDAQRLSLYALDVTPANEADHGEQDTEAPGTQAMPPMYFEVYRAERVRLTSILFSGEDWRWRFCSADGAVVATSEGYASEDICRRAVELLRREARKAEFRGGPDDSRRAG